MLNTLIKLALAETILKPVLIHITKILLKNYLKPLYNTLDEKIKLPEEWESFIDTPVDYIYSIVMEESLPVDKNLFSDLILDQFNLKTYLSKKNG